MTEQQTLAESGFFKLLDFQLMDWDEDKAVLELEIGPQHLNRAKVLHGGVVASMIDLAGGFAGCYCAVPGRIRKAVTLSMTTSFTGQATSGVVRAVGRRRAGGRSIFFATVEITDAFGAMIALGEGTYRYRRGSETPDGEAVATSEVNP